MSPKKPNSGKRRVAKVLIKHVAKRDRLTARIVGYDYLLRKFAHVLVRGGRANDTPGVTYSCIRGSLDFVPFYGKKNRRSFWGLKREELFGWAMLFIKRNLRQQYEGMESFQKEQQALREKTKLVLQPQGYKAYLSGAYSSFWYTELNVASLQTPQVQAEQLTIKLCIQKQRQFSHYFFQGHDFQSAVLQKSKYDKRVY